MDKEVGKIFEKNLFKFKGQTTQRLAFGGFYATLKSSSSAYAFNFFEEELDRVKDLKLSNNISLI